MEQVQREAMSMPYDMLFGRKTYDLFAGHWPDADDDPIADMMTAARKYVVTSSTSGLTWNNSQAVSGDLTREIAKLKREDGPLLQVHGSWQLIQFLLAEDLIDEFRIWTFPVVLGSGKRLFERGARPLKLKLQKSEALADGTVMSLFKRG